MTSPGTDPTLFSPIRFTSAGLELLDQTRLPQAEVWLACPDVATVADAIRRLAVRGAPAIGVAAAYGLVVAARDAAASGVPVVAAVRQAAAGLLATRPTAVNLRWALQHGSNLLDGLAGASPQAVVSALTTWATELQRADMAANRAMGALGAPLLVASRPGGHARILTHCNTGALATAGWGTALGVILAAHQLAPLELVWVDETRPLLQGARLTAWECKRLGLPHRLITDSMAASIMARGLVDAVIVGADRIAANGDTANKIGTYGVAVLAHHHRIPFYVAAPVSTLDPATPDGAAIPIEERRADEVTSFTGVTTAPADTPVANPAFDVTPAALIAAIITERGVLRASYPASIAAVTG